MARDDKISMPSSGAGITRYFDDYESKFLVTPQTGVIIILVVVAILLILTNL